MSDSEGTPEQSRRPLLWWDLGTALLLTVLCVMSAFLSHSDSPRWMAGAGAGSRYVVMLLPLAGFALIYLVVGRRVLRRSALEQHVGRSGPVFLGLLVLLLAWAVFTEPLFALLQALVYPMVWTVVYRYRTAVLWSAVVAFSAGLGIFAGIGTVDPGAGLLSALFSGPLAFIFAVAMGTWISRVFEQGERYRAMAEQLRESQTKVAALSEAAGAAAERERLSRELHDTLTQTLTGLLMLSEQAERALASGQIEQAHERVARVQAASRAAVEEARALVATTQPLGDGGLEQAIERVATNLRDDTGLIVTCELESLPLDREGQVVLLRAAQEGLANARRHARAEQVTVRLQQDGDSARLTVDDDGVGPADANEQESQRPPSGFGLSGLRDRVRLVGGEVRFGKRDGRGARLEISIPLAQQTTSRPGEMREHDPRTRR